MTDTRLVVIVSKAVLALSLEDHTNYEAFEKVKVSKAELFIDSQKSSEQENIFVCLSKDISQSARGFRRCLGGTSHCQTGGAQQALLRSA